MTQNEATFARTLATVGSYAVIIFALAMTIGCSELARDQTLESGNLVAAGVVDILAVFGIAWLLFNRKRVY